MIGIMERETIDLNLNCSPCISNPSIKEEIRQAMINHEITFKEQLTELHRLYWTQKNLMHGLYNQNSCNKSMEVKSNYSLEYQMPLQWNSNSNSNSDTKNNYVSNCTNWVRNDFEIGESSYGTNQKGKNIGNLIDLGKKPINLESDQEEEEDEVICLSKYEFGKCWVDSKLDYNLNMKPEFHTQFSEQTQEFVELDPETNNTSINPLLDKRDSISASQKLFQFDLNIAQNEEDPTDYQSLNISSKGSSITRHADCRTVSATPNPDPEIEPNPVKEKEPVVSDLNEEEEKEEEVLSHVMNGEEMEIDSNVEFAAETLLSIRSKKSEIDDYISEEDSFVLANLNLSEEIKDDATWKSVDKFKVENNENRSNTRSVSLRRGRGLRDFQREVLPGLVSLSRNEICEDLQAIGFEMKKKNRYGRNCGRTGTKGGSRKTRRKRR